MKILNLRDAFRLYDLIGKYLPDIINDDPLEYIAEIIDNILLHDVSEVYIQSISLMSGISEDVLIEYNKEKLLALFISGFTENQIIVLKHFCTGIGYGK